MKTVDMLQKDGMIDRLEERLRTDWQRRWMPVTKRKSANLDAPSLV